MVAINAMLEEGYSLADVTIEDDQTISLKGKKEQEELPNINELEL